MFEELGRLIREEVVLMLFHVELAPADVDQLQPAQQPPGRCSYEHETAAGADVIAAAGGAPSPGAAATALADPPTAAGRQRASRHRPQRPLLVRLRQEIQEMPRRLRAVGEPMVPPRAPSFTRAE